MGRDLRSHVLQMNRSRDAINIADLALRNALQDSDTLDAIKEAYLTSSSLLETELQDIVMASVEKHVKVFEHLMEIENTYSLSAAAAAKSPTAATGHSHSGATTTTITSTKIH